MGMELTRVETDDAASADEVEQLISATFAVTARAANIEPSVREILQQAGLSTKAFYRHFRSKDELLLVALEQGSRRIAEYLQHRMAAQPEPMARIGAWIEGLVRQAMDPEAARKTLPWSLGFGRLASCSPRSSSGPRPCSSPPSSARSGWPPRAARSTARTRRVTPG